MYFCVPTQNPLKAQTVLQNRTVSNTIHCQSGKEYGVWLNISGYNDYFYLSDANFQEFSNGNAKLTGLITNHGNANLKFRVEADFKYRTSYTPSGSPKLNRCHSVNTNDWYYYKQTCGKLYGRGLADGAVLKITRRGPAFQVGNGANETGSLDFGASGWFDVEQVRGCLNPSVRLNVPNGDFNIMLGGGTIPATCDNFDKGGEIDGYEINAGAFDGSLIRSVELPSGGSGPVEYLWMTTTNPDLPITQWDAIPGANGPEYDPGLINETTYFLRCARRYPCTVYHR